MDMIEERTEGLVAQKPLHLNGAFDNYSTEDIEWIARQFKVQGPFVVAPFPGRGNINLHTYEVSADGSEYLLQKVNSEVFTMPHRVMNAMLASIDAQWSSINGDKAVDGWEPIRLVETRDGQPYLDLSDEDGWSVWRLMVRIPKSVSYKSLSEVNGREAQLKLAEEVGRGLAIFSDLIAGIDPEGVEGSLPGYRDTALYYRQFYSVMAGNRTLEQVGDALPEDPIIRASTEQHFLVALEEDQYQERKNDPELAHFLALVADQEPFTKGLWSALEDGSIRHTLIHGDTKIENFLFCAETGRVKSLVDLDTIMPFTWLADWGDMLRSMVNVAGEKERDLSKIVVDRDVYEAVGRGFLGTAKEVTDKEVSMMIFAVQAISLELGLRFMTDYIKGDTYFRLASDDPADLNKVRAMVQLTLYERLQDFAPDAVARIAKYR